jgi:hypothetical protein
MHMNLRTALFLLSKLSLFQVTVYISEIYFFYVTMQFSRFFTGFFPSSLLLTGAELQSISLFFSFIPNQF